MIVLFILFVVGMMAVPQFMMFNMMSDSFSFLNPMQSHYLEYVGDPIPMFIACLIAFILPVYMLVHILLVKAGKIMPLSKASNWTILGIWLVSISVIIFQLI